MSQERKNYTFSPALKAERKEKIGNRCEQCGSKKRLFGHHMMPFFIAKRNKVLTEEIITQEENLLLLCEECHKAADEDQRKWGIREIVHLAWALFGLRQTSVAEAQEEKKEKVKFSKSMRKNKKNLKK